MFLHVIAWRAHKSWHNYLSHSLPNALSVMPQAILPEGPSTYSVEDMDAAGKLAEKVVANYGMTDLGILAYAPPPGRKEFGKRSFEVRGVLILSLGFMRVG